MSPPEIGIRVDIRCTSCGVARDVELPAERALSTDDAVYVEARETCRCGARRVRVRVGAEVE